MNKTKGLADQERCFEQAAEALSDARWRMDISKQDCLPDQSAWASLETKLGDLMFAAYARNHELTE
jgi:hypothetical protein